MVWVAVLLVALGIIFIKLGAYSVWITIFSVALKVAIVVIAGLTLLLIWRWLSTKRQH